MFDKEISRRNSTLALRPHLVMCELDRFYRLSASLQGLALSDVTVSLSPGILTIAGQDDLGPSEDRDDTNSCNGRSFCYHVALPEDADGKAVVVTANDGILTMHIARNSRLI